MMEEERHECRRTVGWEIVKENEIWHLKWYHPRSPDDPDFKPLPDVISKDEDWKALGYFNPAVSTFLVIRYCPFCGEKLEGDEKFYDLFARNG